ncbi:MAG: hypothetical protein DHS20C11_19320 [Lysobacteraceae bacterium]|nr:MAG: hypothetical protein DHS20C11_19320 [Xanthomonadaceae bacterium]
MRGLEMTRTEVFVDAAFAFAVTMLVISFDSIPTNYDEIIVAIKGIPAFIVAVMQLVWIWYTHNRWSRRYGLDDAKTVVLSTALLIVVLVYIYPMRIMAQGFFSWVSGDYFPANFSLSSYDQLADMFVFLGTGFIALCLVFVAMYRHAASCQHALRLNAREIYETNTRQYLWLGTSLAGVICILLAWVIPAPQVPFAGFAFSLLMVWMPLYRVYRRRGQPS